MCSSLLYFFVFMVFIHQVSSAIQDLFPYAGCSNLTSNSAYQSQLDALLSFINAKDSINYGFFTQPAYADTPNVVGLCRGDQQPQACQTCLNSSADGLRQLCPNDKQAIIYNENCTLRYLNETLVGQAVRSVTDLRYSYMLHNENNASDPDSFNKAVRDLFDTLQAEAAGGGSLRKFAASNATTANNSDRIFASVQCVPDLSEGQCTDCLANLYSRLSLCCLNKIGAILLSPSCSFRFEVYPFIDLSGVESLPSPPPAASTSRQDDKSNTTRTIILIVAPVLVAIILVIFIIGFLKMKKKKKSFEGHKEEPIDELCDVEYAQFDLATIKAATNNFCEYNKLGQGGFGAVYKGKLSNGQVVAVKRFSRGSVQGDSEFKNEVMILVKLQHRNLVRLQGFSSDGNEKLLIYEYLENSSLNHFIFNPNKRELLGWDTRYKIIIGIARGLLYLHEDSRLRIIHRDLKASNILLDDHMNPKISDFGLAKLFMLNQTQADTSRIVGTLGYMAPEYAMHGNFSVKSDVYSFGVLVLEIVSGEKNNCFYKGEYVEDLPNHAWRNWTEGTLSKVIDPTLKSGSRDEMERCIQIGLLCVQQNVAIRPTMAAIVHMLNSDSTTLALPSQPACFMPDDTALDMFSTQEHTSKGSEVDQSKNKSSDLSKIDVSITELYPR